MANQPSFEEALEELERIVHRLEDGRIGLNESLANYEQGVKLLRQCHQLLEKAERRIELLSGMDADGNPITTPFEDEALTLDEKSQRRSRRRSASERRIPPESPPPADGDNDVDVPGGLF